MIDTRTHTSLLTDAPSLFQADERTRFGHLLGWKRYADIPTAVGDTGLVAFGFKRKNGIERRWRFQSNCHRGVEVLCNHAAKVAAVLDCGGPQNRRSMVKDGEVMLSSAGRGSLRE